MMLSLYSVLSSNFTYPIPICKQESMSAENFRKLMEMEIFLQDSENLRENLTCVIREEGGYYPEELGFIVNRGFKSRGKEKSNKEYQVRTQKNKGTV